MFFYKYGYLYLILILIGFSNSAFSSKSYELAQKEAITEFNDFTTELVIDVELFSGPKFVDENESNYIFQWISLVPRKGDTIIDVVVPKKYLGTINFEGKGIRSSFLYLMHTLYFPLNEAMLTSLFDLPPSPEVRNEKTKRLREIELNSRQLIDIANFVEIKRNLMYYHYESQGSYPDSLGKLRLDSVYVKDQYGLDYFYKNLGKYVILGSQGKNGKWDFEDIVYDSLFNDSQEYILMTGDDILVKFRPVFW